jgi:hypothetical protein
MTLQQQEDLRWYYANAKPDLGMQDHLMQAIDELHKENDRLRREGDEDARIGRMWVGAALGGWFLAIVLASLRWFGF